MSKIEIDLALPDKYLRSDIGSAGALGMTRTEGFDGLRPFLEVVPNGFPSMRIQTDNPASHSAWAKLALQPQPVGFRAPPPRPDRRHPAAVDRDLLNGGRQSRRWEGGHHRCYRARRLQNPGWYVDAPNHLPVDAHLHEPQPAWMVTARTHEACDGPGRGGSATPVAAPGVASPMVSGAVSGGAETSPADGPQSGRVARQSGTLRLPGFGTGRARGARQADERSRGDAAQACRIPAVLLRLPQGRRRLASTSHRTRPRR